MKNALPTKFHSRIPEVTTLMHPEATASCSSGYRGRTAVTEVLEITTEIQELILQNASEEDFFAAARKNGFVTIQEDAMIKTLNHSIPHEEMLKFMTQVGEGDSLESEDQLDVDNQSSVELEQAIIESNDNRFEKTTTR